MTAHPFLAAVSELVARAGIHHDFSEIISREKTEKRPQLDNCELVIRLSYSSGDRRLTTNSTTIEFSDADDVDAVLENLRADEFRIGSMIREVARSPLFGRK